MSIRTRLLLLVFAVWLPAVAGFALMARITYLREAESARDNVEQLARGLSLLIERELDKRLVMARTLGASSALRDRDLRRFQQEAAAAADGYGSWVVLVDARTQYLNTTLPYGSLTPTPRAPGAPFLGGRPGEDEAPVTFFSMRDPVLRKPVLAVFAAERGAEAPRYNVGVVFEPAIIQALLAEHRVPDGGAGAVIDRDQRVIARSRDPQKWLGASATGDVARRARAGQGGFAESVTLDGVPSLTYLTRPNRYGWAIVIGMPKSTLAASVQRVTLQAAGASGVLLIIGLVLALQGARGISHPVRALRDAAARLGQDQVPPRLSTGLSEADEVGVALHEAGLGSQQAKRTLEQRVAEAVQQAQEAQARLLDGQKHEAIGRLAGGLAHDFNNLLQAISMGLQVLGRGGADGRQQRVLDGATRAADKAAQLVRQMLTFGRAQPLQPQSVDLNDFVLKNQELTSRAVGGRVSLSAAIEPGLAPLFVDPMQLELALLNLVFNARDAMRETGGHIVITGRAPLPGETAALPPGRYAYLGVADDGPGMDAQTRSRAFEPYFTTKPVGLGSGLGLPQVLAFARQSGGDARLDSAPGAGTRIGLLLPTSQTPPVAPGEGPAARRPPRTLHILMAEDDPLVSSVVAPALEGEGHRVTLCPSADAALELLRAGHGPGYDLLFTDVVMPGKLTGMDLAAWCRTHRSALPVVVATGYTSQQADAPTEILRKPYGMAELLDALARAAA